MAKKRVRRSKLVSHRKNKDFSSLLGDSLNEFGVKFVTILKTFLAVYFIPMLVLLSLFIISLITYFGFSNLSLLSDEIALREYILSLTTTNLSGFIFIIFVFVLFAVLINIFLSLAYFLIAFSNKKESTLREVVSATSKLYWRYIAFIVVVMIFLTGLFVLLIIPGIIFSVYWVFAPYILVNERAGIIESLRRSYRIVKGKWWMTFGYSLLLFLIYGIVLVAASFVPFGNIIGTLVLTPIMVIFFKNFYLSMKK